MQLRLKLLSSFRYRLPIWLAVLIMINFTIVVHSEDGEDNFYECHDEYYEDSDDELEKSEIEKHFLPVRPDDFIQGIEGRVRFYQGNFMPKSVELNATDDTPADNALEFVSPSMPRRNISYPRRKVLALEPFKSIHSGHFLKALPSEPVATAFSNDDGYFWLSLRPGKYSLVVEENGRYYASGLDDDDYVFTVKVAEGKVRSIYFDIKYLAAY